MTNNPKEVEKDMKPTFTTLREGTGEDQAHRVDSITAPRPPNVFAFSQGDNSDKLTVAPVQGDGLDDGDGRDEIGHLPQPIPDSERTPRNSEGRLEANPKNLGRVVPRMKRYVSSLESSSYSETGFAPKTRKLISSADDDSSLSSPSHSSDFATIDTATGEFKKSAVAQNLQTNENSDGSQSVLKCTTFLDLSQEMIQLLASYLGAEDLFSFASTCKTVHHLLDEDKLLWARVLAREKCHYEKHFKYLAKLFFPRFSGLILTRNPDKLALRWMKETAKNWGRANFRPLTLEGGQYANRVLINKSTYHVPTMVVKQTNAGGLSTLAFQLWDVRTQEISGLFLYTWSGEEDWQFYLFDDYLILQDSYLCDEDETVGEELCRLNVDFLTSRLVQVWRITFTFPQKNLRKFMLFDQCIVAMLKITHREAPLDCQAQVYDNRDIDPRDSEDVDTEDDEVNGLSCSHRKLIVYSVTTGLEMSTGTFLSFTRKDVHDLRSNRDWIVLYGKPNLVAHNFVTHATKIITIRDSKNLPLLFGEMRLLQGKVLLRRGAHVDRNLDWQLIDLSTGQVIWHETHQVPAPHVMTFDPKTNEAFSLDLPNGLGEMNFISSGSSPTVKIASPGHHSFTGYHRCAEDHYCMFNTIPMLMRADPDREYYLRVDLGPQSYWWTTPLIGREEGGDWHVSPLFVAMYLGKETDLHHKILIFRFWH